MKIFYLIFFLFTTKDFIFCFNIFENRVITSSEKISGIISNYFTHETFLSYTTDTNNIYESSIFFIIRENGINSFYIDSSGSYIQNSISISNLYSISSDYIYIPKYLIYDSNDINKNSIFFGFCTTGNFISVYEFQHDTAYSNQQLLIKNSKNYAEFDLYITKNKCSASAYIGQNDFRDRVFISNAYSIFANEFNKYNINYQIKIFEYMVISGEIDYFVGKSFDINIIDLTTTQQSNFDNDSYAQLALLLNKEGSSLIKCKIINSYINQNLNSDILYDKEIIILCLYYTKDLVNSSPNEPKFSIRLDLFKNDLGDNELSLISYITIKDSISIDKEDTEGKNYLYPDLITFKNNEDEIYKEIVIQKYILSI